MSTEEQLQSLIGIRVCDLKEYYNDIAHKTQLVEEDLSKFCDLILLNHEDQKKRKDLLVYLQKLLTNNNISCKLYYFGSTINGIGFYNSDIDIFFQSLKKSSHQPSKPKDCCPLLKTIHHCIFKNSTFKRFYLLQLIWAKCPILKIGLPNGAPQASKRLVEIDLNASHPLGVYNSIVINFLVSFEPRIKQLCAILKHWAKVNLLIERYGLKSYALVFLVIFFLQNCDTPYISSLDAIFEYSKQFENYVQPEIESELFAKCSKLLINKDKLPSTFELLHQFFKFYYNFDFFNFVISPRIGIPIRKDHFTQIISDDKKYLDFRVTPFLCVEDPFELDRNITSEISFDKFTHFVKLCAFYAKKPSYFFQNGPYFHQFISSISKYPSNASMLNSFCNIHPCDCFWENYYLQHRQLNCENPKSDHEQMFNFILKFSKTLMNSITVNLQTYQKAKEFQDKFVLINHDVNLNCFDTKKATNSFEIVELASFQVKLFQDKQQDINKKRNSLVSNDANDVETASVSLNKKQKIIHFNSDVSNQRFWEGMDLSLFQASNDSISTDVAVTSDDKCPIRKISLYCHFISEKVYIMFLSSSEAVPKWLQKELRKFRNKMCTCEDKPTDEVNPNTKESLVKIELSD